MTIVNACLGGLANAVPAGQAVLNLTWITNDGENQQVTFSISGASTKSVQSDANGYASVQLPVGAYTVAVVHDGEYIGDDPKSVTLTSRGTFALTWLTGARQAQTVIFNSPGSISSSTVSYSIVQGGTTVTSGSSSWSTSMSFELYSGGYTLTLTAYGDTLTKTFTVPKTSGLTVDLSEFFCKVTVSSSYSCRNITYSGYSVSGTSSYASSHSFYVLRASSSRSINGSVDTPTPPSYSGASIASIYTYYASSSYVTPSSATASTSISVSKLTNLVFIISNGTLTVPSGTYKVLVNGGGGGTSLYSSGVHGANGGEIKMYSGQLSGDYSITLGAGGSKNNSGQASSFGTLLSANGGTSAGIGSNRVGVACGAGRQKAEGDAYDHSGISTTGDIGGGGGGVGTIENSSGYIFKGIGGSPGSKYGGMGGNGTSYMGNDGGGRNHCLYRS